MPLILDTLIGNLNPIFHNQTSNPTKEIAARDIARAYFDYVKPALGPNGDPFLFTGNEVSLLQQGLVIAFTGIIGPLTAQAIGLAVTQFWLLPPVITAVGGVVSSIMTATGVAKLMASNAKNLDQGAANFAQALHLMTKTVSVNAVFPLLSGLII